MSWKSSYWQVVDESANFLSVSLVDKDKIRQVEEIKRQQSSKLSDIQRENKALKRQTVDLEIDRAGMQALLRDRLNTTLNINDKNIREDIKELTEQWKAVTNRSANEDHEKNIDLLGKRLIETNATVAAREEVYKKSDKSKNFTSTSIPQPSSSRLTFPRPQSTLVQQPPTQQQQSSNSNRRSLGNRFSALFSPRKANTKPSSTDDRESRPRAPRPPSLATTAPIPTPPPTRPGYYRKDGDVKRRTPQS